MRKMTPLLFALVFSLFLAGCAAEQHSTASFSGGRPPTATPTAACLAPAAGQLLADFGLPAGSQAQPVTVGGQPALSLADLPG